MLFSSKHFFLFVIFNAFRVCLCSEDEERLVGTIFKGYNKLIRPVKNNTEKIDIQMGLAFLQLISVNERMQIMKSNVWLHLSWKDFQLTWNRDDYNGIQVLRLPMDKVWKPDIVLFNNADGNYEVRYKSNVLIYEDGTIVWVPPAIYQSSCRIDVTYFPFDQQTCVMKFGSWTFNGDQVSLSLIEGRQFVDLTDYSKSGTWDMVRVPAYLNVYRDKTPTETDISFQIVIRRKALFYTINLIVPTVLISFLCVLVFYLPAEASEKVTLGISILLSLVVFLLLVSKILPPTSIVVPLIAKYLLFTFIMNAISILVTVIIINCNFRSVRTHRMSRIVRLIFLKILPPLLFMRRPKKTRLRWMMDMPNHNVPTTTYLKPTEIPENMSFFGDKTCMEALEMQNLHHPNCIANHIRKPERQQRGNSDLQIVDPDLKNGLKAVEFMAEHLKNQDLFIQTREDWKYVAMVIDRLQLYIFFAVTTIGTIGVLLDAPYIFDKVDQDEVIKSFSLNTTRK